MVVRTLWTWQRIGITDMVSGQSTENLAMRILLALLTALLIVFGAAPAVARQDDERYAELKAIPQLINDPDPLRRIVNFESIMAEKDQLKTDLAIRIAMGIEDDQLRALALKAYLSTVSEVIFDWTLPEEISDKAKQDPERLSRTEQVIYKDHAPGAALDSSLSGRWQTSE